MFTNFQHKSVLSALDELPYNFYLTGSRYFTGHGNDIDFFIEHDSELELELTRLGFRTHSSSQYSDSQCLFVMRHKSERIDVQFVQNAELKQRIQERFKTLGKVSPTTDEWNLAFELLK